MNIYKFLMLLTIAISNNTAWASNSKQTEFKTLSGKFIEQHNELLYLYARTTDAAISFVKKNDSVTPEAQYTLNMHELVTRMLKSHQELYRNELEMNKLEEQKSTITKQSDIPNSSNNSENIQL